MINSNQGFDWHNLRSLLRHFLSDVNQAFTNPQANTKTTILIIAILALLTIIASLFIWLAISSVRSRHQKILDVLTAKHFKVTRREAWTGRIIFAVALIISISAVYYYGSRPEVCERCHSGELVQNLKKSTHKGISCLSCHSRPGIDGSVAQFIDYTRWLSASVFKKEKERYDAQVSNEACLRCHYEITRKIVSQWGVRMRHTDVLEKGLLCTDCHNSVAHGKALAVNNVPTMDKCLACHNNKQASASCDTCHTSKAKPTTRKIESEIIKIDVAAMKNCRSCYPQTQDSICIKCHGLEMPHPDDWVGDAKKHALPGFTNKRLCKKCHIFKDGLSPIPHAIEGSYPSYQIFCDECHNYPSVHGSTERWLKYHGMAASGGSFPPNKLCGKCHPAENERKCFSCHQGGLCTYCHSGSAAGAVLENQK
ncbi:MAG: cytochrome c3 family protein [Actinomycetota bacterium]